uniref:Uncharacterized protein n=1 Tax=Arundo donax TaxID=35708 RepID=A0A0A9FHR2_ARUDO
MLISRFYKIYNYLSSWNRNAVLS